MVHDFHLLMKNIFLLSYLFLCFHQFFQNLHQLFQNMEEQVLTYSLDQTYHF